MSAMTDKPSLSPNRSSRSGVDDDAYAGALARQIRAMGRRVAGADPSAAALLQALDAELQQAWATAVAGWRAAGETDKQIGAALGITKQAVQQRWPR